MKRHSFFTTSLLLTLSLCLLSTHAVAACTQSDLKGFWNLTGDAVLMLEGYDIDLDTAISDTPEPLGPAWCNLNINVNGVVRGGRCVEGGENGRSNLKPLTYDEFGDPLSQFFLNSNTCRLEGILALYDKSNPEVEPVVCIFVQGAIDHGKSTINASTVCVLLRADNLADVTTFSSVGVRRK